jgi:hypothetical protein
MGWKLKYLLKFWEIEWTYYDPTRHHSRRYMRSPKLASVANWGRKIGPNCFLARLLAESDKLVKTLLSNLCV